MGALKEENTTCESETHLHKSTVCVRQRTIYTPQAGKQITGGDRGGEEERDERR